MEVRGVNIGRNVAVAATEFFECGVSSVETVVGAVGKRFVVALIGEPAQRRFGELLLVLFALELPNGAEGFLEDGA